MATAYSEQRLNDTAIPPVQNDPVSHGRVIRSWFDLNTTDTNAVADGDTVELCKIPAGVRVVGGKIVFGAMGALATALIGISGDTDKYAASTDVSAAGSADLAGTEALNFGQLTTAEETILLTAGGASYAADKNILGYIEYISAGQ